MLLISQKKIWILFALIVFLSLIQHAYAETEAIAVRGEVKNILQLTIADLKKMPSFQINKVALLEEKKQPDNPEKFMGMHSYKGVLLRDILEKAKMKYIRKWEPGVYIRVKGANNREDVFSFGEVFYSSIGRSILLAYEKDGKPIFTATGIGELLVSTDIRAGRMISGVSEILVERVNIKMEVYDDRRKNIIHPPTSQFTYTDYKRNKTVDINLKYLNNLPFLRFNDVVMVGDCEGFKGVYSFEGPSLRSLLEKIGVSCSEENYNRYVVISSVNGFSATFSLGEIFNSRLGDNIIIAYKKNGLLLDPEDGFARSVVREDSAGGRSVRRIHRIELH